MLPCRRLPRLLTELAIARADGSYPKLLASLAKTEVLVIDDVGLAKLSDKNRRDLLKIIEDRYAIRSTTSQLPVENWHAVVGEASHFVQPSTRLPGSTSRERPRPLIGSSTPSSARKRRFRPRSRAPRRS